MVKTKVFLICLSVMIVLFSAVAACQMYAMERAIARGIFADVLDDMQDIGYLDPALADYYRQKMAELGWDVTGDVFAGSWPQAEQQRALKEQNEMVTLTLTVRPSRVAQWLNQFAEGNAAFFFTGSRPSEYFDPGW
jgi:hypothetical protein